MNPSVTSREAILATCRALVCESGLSALNMRAVAQRCDVALGSLYNYFPSKGDLMVAVIESVWKEIFHVDHACEAPTAFPDHVAWIFERVRAGTAAYPDFFTAHSISLASAEKSKARDVMQKTLDHMKLGLHKALADDPLVREDAFSDRLTPSDLVDFVLMSTLSLLVQREPSCHVLLEMIRRTLY